jgi:molybdate transport system ATP-binding protein
MTNRPDRPFITLENVTIRLQDRFILPNTFWEIKTNQNWMVMGPNGAGKTALVQALAGMAPVVGGRLIRHFDPDNKRPIGYVSFEIHQELIAREERTEEIQSVVKEPGRLTTVRNVIQSTSRGGANDLLILSEIAAELQIGHLLDREILTLSTGEMRKVLIARAMLKLPKLLVLDEPFDGLDQKSQARLAESIKRLMRGNIQLVLVTHRQEELIPGITHILTVRDDKVHAKPLGDDFTFGDINKNERAGKPHHEVVDFLENRPAEKETLKHVEDTLIRMSQVTVKYDDLLVIDRLDWVVKKGEHWAIIGPNGAGKTTLTTLISGDHAQAYANEINILGRKKGSGETVWEIKRHIGMVSSEFQIRYRKPLHAVEVVLSGFFDSVGLYRQATFEQRKIAKHWMERLGVIHLSDRFFHQLSFGEKRMVLLARSMVKSPIILILDEPCQGLDRVNKKRVLDMIHRIGQNGSSHLIYVTHHEDEMPGCITHVLNLTPHAKNGLSAIEQV